MSKPLLVVAASATVALLVPLSGCASGGGTSPFPTGVVLPTPIPSATPTTTPTPNGPVTATGQYRDLIFTLATPKRVYGVGETVPLTFTV